MQSEGTKAPGAFDLAGMSPRISTLGRPKKVSRRSLGFIGAESKIQQSSVCSSKSGGRADAPEHFTSPGILQIECHRTFVTSKFRRSEPCQGPPGCSPGSVLHQRVAVFMTLAPQSRASQFGAVRSNMACEARGKAAEGVPRGTLV